MLGDYMIKNKIKIIASLLLIVSTLSASDWVVDGVIAGSPHDLSGTTTGAVGSDDNGEVCVYCHTPHAANSEFDGAPLWNKAATAGTVTYRMYGATAADTQGTTISGTLVGDATGNLSSPSLACLSCHDGVSAIDSIVNAPGSGMGSLSAGGTLITAIATPFGGNIGDGDNAVADVDMANDHPVSVAYTAGKASLRATGDTLATASGTAWVGATLVSDLLRNGLVECSSCHDPHNGYAAQGVDAQVNYLRTTNAGSALCIGCHNK